MRRRTLLRGLLAAGGAAALAACLDRTDEDIPTGNPDERPARQHAWNELLQADDHGNRTLPVYHTFLSLAYTGESPETDREVLEAALTDLERAYEASHEGLLFTLGYSPAYFERFDSPLDVDLPSPGPLVPGENVAVDDADAFLHLASDHVAAVLGAEEALFGDDPANGIDVTTIEGLFEVTGRRTGFVGPGLPAERDRHLQGIPEGEVHDDAPSYMNFRSGFRANQAAETRVTIRNGRFAGGTTTHVSVLRLLLDEWFDHSPDGQVARLFAPNLDTGDVGEVGEELTDHNRVSAVNEKALREVAREHGVVGHAQKLARFREDGRPPILRRDVNSDDGGEAGVVFVSLQRDVADFERLRLAMEGTDLTDEGVGEREDNGILRYIQTRRRGNFLVPPRSLRSLP